MCAGIGRDATSGDMALRLLAVDLACAGYPTLRFDYPGTGDSLDLDGKDPCAPWLASIDAAADFLKQTGVRQLVFCGIRLGALLAASTARQRDDVGAVVIIDPVTSGNRYLRELEIKWRLLVNASATDSASEVDGLRFESGPDAPLRALSLLSADAMPARRILVLNSESSSSASKLAERLRGQGSEVAERAFEPMTDHDRNGDIPRASNIGIVRNWLLSAMPSTARSVAGINPPFATGTRTKGFVEQPLNFGPSGRLFGVLCRPQPAAAPNLVVVIGNSGAAPHHGHSRFHVMLARRLAAAGIASLRFDFGGIGESLPHEAEKPIHVYETDRTSDFAAAFDVLQAMGYRRFTVGGMCSGAFHAWQAALADDRVEVLLMLNPAAFSWRKGQPFAQFLNDNHRSTQFYVSTMRSRRGWARLLRGELNVYSAIGTLRAHGVRRIAGVATRVFAARGWLTERDSPIRSMQRLSKRGVRTLIAVGTTDGGLDVLQSHFGHGARGLVKLPGSSISFLPGVDHALTRGPMRVQVAEVFVDFLEKTYSCRTAGVVPAQDGSTLQATQVEMA